MRTIITLALLCTLAACGGGGDSQSGAEHDATTQPVHCSASAPSCA
jgi:hypothetical protein